MEFRGQYHLLADTALGRRWAAAMARIARVAGPNGATECSHGWSGAAAMRPDAEPVENGYFSSSSRPSGAKEVFGPTKGRLGAAIPPPPWGGCVETRTFPRVPHRPLCSGRCFTRGYSPPPRWGGPSIHDRFHRRPGFRAGDSSPRSAGGLSPGRWPFPNPVPDFRPWAAVCHFGSFLAPQPARLWRVPQPLFSHIFPPLARKLCTMAYGHASMLQTIKFGSKSVKKATFSVKKASKRRAFRHAHLNIRGGHPLWR